MIKGKFYLFIVSFIVCSAACYAHEQSNNTSKFNIEKMQKLTGQTGRFELDKTIYKLVIPRNDLTILMSGMQLAVDRGLSSTINFEKRENQTIVNGDLILLQDQVNPVMSVALDNGLEVTGLNNPYLWDSPRVMVMRIKGEGDALQLAKAVGAVLKKINETAKEGGDFPLGDTNIPKTSLNTHAIDVLLKVKGQFNGDIYQVQFKNAMKKTDAEINKKMAANTWVSFAGSDNEAIINGALVIHQSELQQALMALRKAKIYIQAIYHYPIDDDSELVSVAFWGIGNIQTLVKPLRSTFLLAQNTNSEKIKMTGYTAVPLIVVHNPYCSFDESTMMATANSIEKETPKAELSPRPAVAPHAEPVIETKANVPMPSALLQSVDSVKTLFSRMPSAAAILSQLSVVKNNQPGIAFLVQPRISNLAVTTSSLPKIAKANNIPVKLSRNRGVPSAAAILLTLSVVKNNQPGIAFLAQPRVKNLAVTTSPLPEIAKPNNVPVKLTQNRVVPSAAAILLKLSVVKNNRIVVLFLPHHSRLAKNAVSRFVL